MRILPAWGMDYFDYQATTPCDPQVVEAMAPYWTQEFGNPHSPHAFGVRAATALEAARQQIAKIMGGKAQDYIFTSGATEANGLAILGVMGAASPKKRHIITCATEHKSVLETCLSLARQGYTVTVLPVDRKGHLSLELLKQSIRADTCLVSLMTANNEIGLIHPIAEILKICHDRGVWLHTDATQAVGFLPPRAFRADLVSFSGHKIYGPKGVGVLYVAPHIKIRPLIYGGVQEQGKRPGTPPVPLCVGMAKALVLAEEHREQEKRRLAQLQELFLGELRALSGWQLNGGRKDRLPNNINVSIEGVDREDLLAALPEFALSSGSACNTEEHFSHVLEALDPEEKNPPAALRIGFGRGTTEEAVRRLVSQIITAVQQLRVAKPSGGKRACATQKGTLRSSRKS
ncbi:MAG: cysteine desulfurase [Holosporales bacterium]|nr:cysteine desulfurase [Holosporales bacterium]